MPTRERIRVYLLDDHEVLRAGVRAVLEGHGGIDVVGESGSSSTVVDQITALEPHVVVLDTRVGNESGLEIYRRVRAARPSVRGLVLTAADGVETVRSAVLAGASGVLPKSSDAARLSASVVSVAGGHRLLDLGGAAELLERSDAPLVRRLTEREHDILDLIGEGLSNREISTRLFVAEKTVRNHVTQILAKLDVRSRTQAALVAARQRR